MAPCRFAGRLNLAATIDPEANDPRLDRHEGHASSIRHVECTSNGLLSGGGKIAISQREDVTENYGRQRQQSIPLPVWLSSVGRDFYWARQVVYGTMGRTRAEGRALSW